MCQGVERVPDGTGAARLLIGTYAASQRPAAGPPGRGRPDALDGPLPRAGRRVRSAIPMTDVAGDHDGSRLCITNEGRARSPSPGRDRDPPIAATVDGRPSPARVWIQYLEPRERL